MDNKRKCKRCGAPLKTGSQLLCQACDDCSDATVAPTPGFANDATVFPGLSGASSTTLGEVGDYELIEEIARGGMGVVYKAKHRSLNRLAAVKMILGGRFSSDEESQRFRIEAESAAKLDHPAIVPIYEIGDHEGQSFFAMKYVDGGALASSSGSFRDRPREAALLMVKVAEGVHHAHQRGVLHRDLKPANILLDKDEEPYVTDLGLAKSTTGGSDLTHTGAVLGTPGYMPPEQASGEPVTTAADVYSLGAILYELLVGRPPYSGDTSVSIVMKVIDGPPPAPQKIHPLVDRDLELICLKAMARKAQDRYSSAQEMANDLQAWLAGQAISVKPPSVRAIVVNWVKQNQRLTYAAFALIVGILICSPVVISFFSENVGSVYTRFPDGKKPLLFSIQFPRWLSFISAVFLILVLWPSIGLLNSAISRSATLSRALWSGVSTAAVLSLIFYCLLGWLIFLQGANNATRKNISIVANGAWPDYGHTNESAMREANRLFGGLQEIPEPQRAGAVTQRIKSDVFASAPTSFAIGCLVAFVFSIPIVYGTVMGFVLQRRALPAWLYLLRYIVAWWLTSVVLIGTIMMIGTLFVDQIKFQGEPFTGNHYVDGFVGFSIALFIVWLVLRKWKRAERPFGDREQMLNPAG